MIPVQKEVFLLAGILPKSRSMTTESSINTADTSKVHRSLMVETDTLTMSEISGDDISIEKVSGCARKFLVVDDVFHSCSDPTKTLVHARDVDEMSTIYCASDPFNSEFPEFIKKSLLLCGNTVHDYKTPHKTSAGFRGPKVYEAAHDAPGVFFCAVS